jgi:uncharacterized protein with PIN domain
MIPSVFECPYCKIDLIPLGRGEHHDELGLYVAEVWRCAACGYRLEREPIYLDEDKA